MILSLFTFLVFFQSQVAPIDTNRRVIDDFERYEAGDYPIRWMTRHRGRIISYDRRSDDEYFQIHEENGQKFVRVTIENESHRMLVTRDDRLDWNLEEFPTLAWDWRAIKLPPDAREDTRNDTGAAVYVIFKVDWLGRPTSIKYTYSSTLPVGTIVDYGRLKVVVVSSGADGTGAWLSIERDVAADYEDLFGKDPPVRPVSIMLWSDSDNTKSVAIADFDNIEVRR